MAMSLTKLPFSKAEGDDTCVEHFHWQGHRDTWLSVGDNVIHGMEAFPITWEVQENCGSRKVMGTNFGALWLISCFVVGQ
jgi:hypothetical protein